MLDDLLPLYNSELRFMRELAQEFAAANPKIAGRLRLSQDSVEDPHVGRLIEAFAFLNARMRLKLEDDFPELTGSMLELLQPHYLAPFPSMSIVQLAPQPEQIGHAAVPAGQQVVTEPVDGEPLTYRTGYPVDLWPIALTNASLSGLPFVAPPSPRASAAAAVLRLTLTCLQPDATFTGLGLDRLRVYLHGEPRTTQILYELVMGATLSVALADNAVDPTPVILGPEAIQAVGFSEDELLLPHPPAAEPGYALIREYFGFPEKFLFFDLVGLEAKTLLQAGRTLDVFLYLDRHEPQIEHAVGPADFRLFCTPIVNLFEAQADPIRLDPGRYEHRVIPDARRESTLEVYSVDKVTVSDRAGDEMLYRPYFSFGQRQQGRDPVERFWHAVRRPSPYDGGGDDVFLVATDADGRAAADGDHVASIDITATNRDAALRLPFGGGRPRLNLPATGHVARCEALMAPTRPLRQRRGRGALWRVVSHLSLNHLSADNPGGLEVLKEMLSLYDSADSAASRAVIDRLSGVDTQPAVARAPAGGRIAFASGVDVTLEFDDQRVSGSGAFLLGAVLETAFGAFAAINAFSRTRLKLKGEKGLWQAWPARTGTKRLI